MFGSVLTVVSPDFDSRVVGCSVGHTHKLARKCTSVKSCAPVMCRSADHGRAPVCRLGGGPASGHWRWRLRRRRRGAIEPAAAGDAA